MGKGNTPEPEFVFDKGSECNDLDFFSIDRKKKEEWLGLESTKRDVPLRDRVIIYLSSCNKIDDPKNIWLEYGMTFVAHYMMYNEEDKKEVYNLLLELTENYERQDTCAYWKVNIHKIERELKKVILRYAEGLGFVPKNSWSVVDNTQAEVTNAIPFR